MELEVNTKCDCEENEALPAHNCPFKIELHNDSETLCTCCEACKKECAGEK